MEKTAIDFDDSQEELFKILDQISDLGNTDEQKIFIALDKYYKKYNRHLYSAISLYIENNKEDDTIDYLAEGVKLLYAKCFLSEEYIDLAEKMAKLYDHISLEYNRLIAVTRKFNQEIRETTVKVERFNDRLNEFQSAIKIEEKKLDSMQKEYIAILGIFAAIVIAFVGQMTFSMSVLANVYRLGDIFTIIAVVAMIGLAFINVLFSLFYFVGKLVKDDGIISLKAWIALNIIVGVIITLMIGMHFLIESHLMDVILLKIKNVF